MVLFNGFINNFGISSNDISSRSEVFSKRGILKISQKSQESTCARVSFFNKVGGLGSATLLKKRSWDRCFFYRTHMVVASEMTPIPTRQIRLLTEMN